MTDDYSKPSRGKSPRRAARSHQGTGHWHVERRSSVIICRRCQAKIPTWKRPPFCPECGDGRSD